MTSPATRGSVVERFAMCGWIEERYATKEKCTNRCNEAVREMVSRFDNLTVQVGYANAVVRLLDCRC